MFRLVLVIAILASFAAPAFADFGISTGRRGTSIRFGNSRDFRDFDRRGFDSRDFRGRDFNRRGRDSDFERGFRAGLNSRLGSRSFGNSDFERGFRAGQRERARQLHR